MIVGLITHAFAQPAQHIDTGAQGAVGGDTRLDFNVARWRELAVDECVELMRAEVGAQRFVPSCSGGTERSTGRVASGASASRISAQARDRCDITVPIGASAMRAMSL